MQVLHPSTREHERQDISCTDPQVHLQTRSCVRLESLWACLSSGVKAPNDAKDIEQRLLLNSALQGPQIPMLCFQPLEFHLFWTILEEQLRSQHCFCEMMLLGDQTRMTTLRWSSQWHASLQDRQMVQPFPIPALGHPSNTINQPPTISWVGPFPFSPSGCGGRWVPGCSVSIVLCALSMVVPRTTACLACRNAQCPWSG